MIIKEFQNSTQSKLTAVYSESEAKYISDLLISKFLKISKIQLVLKAQDEISEALVTWMNTAVERLLKNEPFQYILEEEAFYGLDFFVNKNVLIPRPETEELVEWILNTANTMKGKLSILDIGTGSGCIPISIKHHLKDAEITAFDVSEEALAVAKKNSIDLKTPINFELVDILDKNKWEQKQFDIIVSNPPYIPYKERDLMHENVLKYEPGLALFVENDEALIFFSTIIDYAMLNLKKDGFLFFECNEYNAVEVVKLLEDKQFTNISLRKDINGRDRMIKAQLI